MKESRQRSLDVLRAAAVLLVMGRHLEYCPPNVPFFHSLAKFWYYGGWVGVDLFFVLSGFLIAGLLFEEHQRTGSISFRRFFIRRGFKIYPPFYALCVMTLVFGWSAGPRALERFLHEVFFLQNYLDPLWFHTWSLAVEEHFYLLLPWLLIFLSQRKNERPFSALPALCFTTAAACLAARLWTRTAFPDFDVRVHLVPTHLRLDSLFFGVLLSYFYHYHRPRFDQVAFRFGGPLFTGGLILLAPAFFLPIEKSAFLATFGFSFFYLGAGMVLTSMVVREELFRGKAWAAPAFIGAHSYSIYLWHVFIFFCCKAVLAAYGSWPFYFVVAVGGSLAMGIVMSRLVELPSLRLREKWFPERL